VSVPLFCSSCCGGFEAVATAAAAAAAGSAAKCTRTTRQSHPPSNPPKLCTRPPPPPQEAQQDSILSFERELDESMARDWAADKGRLMGAIAPYTGLGGAGAWMVVVLADWLACSLACLLAG